jgi:hypothetical protein
VRAARWLLTFTASRGTTEGAVTDGWSERR